ncbi:hypothetical protein GWO43_11275, partial [candidate division KSB1 bacterium]|nr:hypothetical protein [Nitrospinaceae bacterium]NIR49010.1 hypothetical protein [candidate division KSB1 bacterium]NIS23234.1 hypothetical protein [candidate division KSB1 bacterium]NIT71448.1 hypothetical protein [candidate division KSB1 bacterium]NIU23230.1 hypothetical protein [candidate division KSB1 bacterium]
EDLLRQIQEIKIIIPDLRGTIEQNQSDFMASAKETNQKLADLEAHLKFEIHDNLKKQQEREEKLQASL